MKTIFYCGVLLLLGTLTAWGGDTRSQLERETGKLSATLLYDDWRQHFAEQGFAPGERRMEAEMRKTPEKWVRTAVARKAAEAWFTAELQQEYRKAAQALLAPFAGDLGAEALKKLEKPEDAWLRSRVQALFPKSFQTVRTKLAEEQRARVFKKCYPTPEELEQYDDARLRTLLQARFRKGAGEALWEENENLLLGSVIDPAIAAGRAMQKRQLELVTQTPLAPTLWDLKAVAETLRAIVQRELAQYPPEMGRIFPAAEKAIVKRAAELPEERVAAAFPKTVDLEKYATMVQQDPQKHRIAAESFQRIRPEITARMIREAVEKAAVPADRRQTIVSSASMQQRADRYFQQQIVPQCQKVRDQLAAAQLERVWPELTRDWRPEPEAVEAFAAGGMQELPELKEYPQQPLLAETERLLKKTVRARLTAECLRLEKQHLAVHRQYDEVFTALQQEQQERRGSWLSRWFGGGTISLAAVVASYRQKVEPLVELPLFPEVEREIEIRSRAILQLLQEEASPEEQNLPMVTLTVTLTEKDGRSLLQFEGWKQESPVNAPIPADALVAALSRRISAEKEPAQFTIRLAVTGDKIYYRTVADLRNALQHALGGKIEDQLQP